LQQGDLLLICSDGLWSGISAADIAAGPGEGSALEDWLARMASRAVRMCTPHSDNTTAVALRLPAD
jgi:serine/threonine protein phosphatase PrpC